MPNPSFAQCPPAAFHAHEPAPMPTARPDVSRGAAAVFHVVGALVLVLATPVVLLIWGLVSWSYRCKTGATPSRSDQEAVMLYGLLWTAIPAFWAVLARLTRFAWQGWATIAVLTTGATVWFALTLGCG